MSIASAFARLRRAQANTRRQMAKARPAGASVAEGVAQRVARMLTPMVRRFLLQNYDASGLKVRSGELKGAVGRAEVEFVSRRRGAQLKIRFPKSPALKKSKSRDRFMAKAESLNSGYVKRSDGVQLGQKAKKTLKRLATGKGASRRARGSLARGIQGKQIKRGGVKVGASTVVGPRDYFRLKDGQKRRVMEEFRRLFQRELQRSRKAA